MEIIIGLAIVAVGVIWYFNAQKKKPETNNDAQAPYKVEPPKATVNAADLAGATVTPEPAKCGCGSVGRQYFSKCKWGK